LAYPPRDVVKSNSRTFLRSRGSKPDLPRNNSDEAQTRAREREEKALRRRTIHADSSPSSKPDRSSWINFSSDFQHAQPLFPISRAAPKPQELSSPSASKPNPTPPRTMLVAQAAKKLHGEELERKKRELQETRQREQDLNRSMNRQSSSPEGTPVKKTSTKAATPPSTAASATGSSTTGSAASTRIGRVTVSNKHNEVPQKEERRRSSLSRWFSRHFSPARK